MKYHYSSQTVLTLLMTGISLATLLTACDFMGDNVSNPFSTGRKEQVVDGPRRVPEYNPQVHMLPPDAPEQLPVFEQKTPAPPPVRGGYNNTPMVTTPPPAPPPANPSNNPYDNYDENGNPVGPKTSAQPTPPPASQSSFFSRAFSNAPPPPPPAATQHANMPVPLLGDMHKPIPGNPHYSDETTEIAPLPPGPDSTTPVVPQDTTPAVSSQPTSQLVVPPAETQMASEEPAEKTTQSAASGEKGSWFSRTFKTLKAPFESRETTSEDEVQKMDTAEDSEKSFPKLSSVPAMPDEFKAVKAGKQDQMEDLAIEHMQAEQDKASLDSEPSQFDINKPVVTAAKSVPPVNVQPVQKTANVVTPQTQAPGNGPVLLGHVSDNQAQATALTPPVMQPQSIAQPQPAEFKTQPPAPVEQTKEVEPQLPPPVEQAEENVAPPAEENSARHPYWWEGWNLMGKKKEQEAAEEPANEPVAAEEQPAQQPVAAAPQPAMPTPLIVPAQTQATTAPVPQNTSLPDLTPSAPPVAEDDSNDTSLPAAAASNTPASGLPSPEILQQVKTLPASRYSLRNQAYQHPADEQ